VRLAFTTCQQSLLLCSTLSSAVALTSTDGLTPFPLMIGASLVKEHLYVGWRTVPLWSAVTTAVIPKPSWGRVELRPRSHAARGAEVTQPTVVALSPQHTLRRSSRSRSVSMSPHTLVTHSMNIVTLNSRAASTLLNKTQVTGCRPVLARKPLHHHHEQRAAAPPQLQQQAPRPDRHVAFFHQQPVVDGHEPAPTQTFHHLASGGRRRWRHDEIPICTFGRFEKELLAARARGGGERPGS
jgi:hypothetical protein